MQFMSRLGTLLLLALLAVACGEDKGGASTSATAPAGQPSVPSAGTPGSPAATQVPAASLTNLSLVYVDARAGTRQLFVSKSDGTSPRKVLDLPQGSSVADVRDNLVLVRANQALTIVDLRDGKAVDIRPSGSVREARFADSETVLYVTAAGCGGDNLAKPTLFAYSIKDGASKEVYAHSQPGANITIAGIGKDGALAISPRGCDVGVSEVLTLNYKTSGSLQVRTPTRGCGFVIASLESMDALVASKGCTTPDSKDATIYALLPSARGTRDLRAPAGGANQQPWVMRPGGQEAALGTSQMVGTGPGSTRGSGLWLVSMRTGEFKDLAPAAGAEQYAVSWTLDGRYLVAAAVQAQGLCSYSIIDANDKKTTPLPETISFCGVNGEVVGLTLIR